MTPHKALGDVWADMAAVREVRDAFGLEGLEQPEAWLRERAYAVAVQHLNDDAGYAGPQYMLRGKDPSEPRALLLIRIGDEFVAVRDDQDVGDCRQPICDGEFRTIEVGGKRACENQSCPNFGRWQ